MTFSKYKKTVIACILALGIGVGGGYYFFGSPVNTQHKYFKRIFLTVLSMLEKVSDLVCLSIMTDIL